MKRIGSDPLVYQRSPASTGFSRVVGAVAAPQSICAVDLCRVRCVLWACVCPVRCVLFPIFCMRAEPCDFALCAPGVWCVLRVLAVRCVLCVSQVLCHHSITQSRTWSAFISLRTPHHGCVHDTIPSPCRSFSCTPGMSIQYPSRFHFTTFVKSPTWEIEDRFSDLQFAGLIALL